MSVTKHHPQRAVRLWVLGIGALFSGAALLAHILSGIALPLALALTVTILLIVVGLVWRRTSLAERRPLLDRVMIGLMAGIAATLVYDVAKWSLAHLDPSPYNPFEALPMFGLLLTGPAAPAGLRLAAGVAFHLINGSAFGIAYCFLFGRRGMLPGIAWGIFLELFQLTLYPGWLDIRTYDEFARISALSHVVYGAVLGWSCRYGLERLERQRTHSAIPPTGSTDR